MLFLYLVVFEPTSKHRTLPVDMKHVFDLEGEWKAVREEVLSANERPAEITGIALKTDGTENETPASEEETNTSEEETNTSEEEQNVSEELETDAPETKESEEE